MNPDRTAELFRSSTTRRRRENSRRYLSAKRAFDIVSSSIMLVFLSPLLALVAALVRMTDGGPALYRHERIGRNGVPFQCLKFRTMRVDGDAVFRSHLATNPCAREEWKQNQKLKNDPRVTTIGQLLRATSLDELPQLFNIIRGDMSVVGPRPVPIDELARYGRSRREYLSVRPGLTGLWQISGRSDTAYEDRVALDMRYIRESSLFLDFTIIIKTVYVVFMRKGSY